MNFTVQDVCFTIAIKNIQNETFYINTPAYKNKTYDITLLNKFNYVLVS